VFNDPCYSAVREAKKQEFFSRVIIAGHKKKKLHMLASAVRNPRLENKKKTEEDGDRNGANKSRETHKKKDLFRTPLPPSFYSILLVLTKKCVPL
jgi:hypothetical protein